jgi:protein-S-isoprenylcysteine O-methyltransferase Ste14
MKFVDDVKQARRWISVQAMAAALSLQGAWAVIPDELKASIPAEYVQGLTLVLLVLGIVGRLVKQEPKP